MENQANVILYQTNNLPQAINVRVENETVWLNRQQIAMLFDRDIKTIGKHINNALAQELMGFPTVANFATVQIEGKRSVMRNIEYYNLDMILSVGYRVNSPNGIAFRIWANEILKNYLLRGYAINARIDSVEHRVSKLEFQNHEINSVIQKALPLEQGIFSDGRIFDAYVFVSDLIKSAKKSIVLIDNYVDESVLLLLSKRKKKVSAKILAQLI